MQKTTLGLTATPGRVHTFVAKASQITPKLDVTLSDSAPYDVALSSAVPYTVTLSDATRD
jgi:hypothetical protein